MAPSRLPRQTQENDGMIPSVGCCVWARQPFWLVGCQLPVVRGF